MGVSILATGKNDGYGGLLKERATLALNTMIDNYDEVIYVDWCSENDDSLINHLSINKMKKLKHIQIKSSDIKNLMPDVTLPSFVEVLSRNVGIRRASNEWIVSSNIDVMPASVNVAGLDKEKIYTTPRRNVYPETFLLRDTTFASLLASKDIFEKVPTIQNDIWAGEFDPWSKVVCCGDFQLANKQVWSKIRGFEESMIHRAFSDTNVMKKAELYAGGPEIIDIDIFQLEHSRAASGGSVLFNDKFRYLSCFTETSNQPDWGFDGYPFFEEII
jgi:hypothetical protein